MHRTSLSAIGSILLIVGGLAACSGGGGSSPVAAPTSGPSNAAVTQNNVSVSSGSPLTLPSSGGVSGSILLNGTIQPGTTAAVTTAFGPPSGDPQAATSTGASVIYSWLQFSNAVALTTFPTLTFNLGSLASSNQRRLASGGYTLGFFDPNNAAAGYQSGGSCSGGSTVVCGGGATAITFAGGTATYVFVLLNVPSSQASASPAPAASSASPAATSSPTASATATGTPALFSTPSPTPPPSGGGGTPTNPPTPSPTPTPVPTPICTSGTVVVCVPPQQGAFLDLTQNPPQLPLNVGQQVVLTVSESRFSGTFTTSSNNPNVSVSAVSGGQFTLTCLGQVAASPGALITVSDGTNTTTISVSAGSTGIVISSRAHR